MEFGLADHARYHRAGVNPEPEPDPFSVPWRECLERLDHIQSAGDKRGGVITPWIRNSSADHIAVSHGAKLLKTMTVDKIVHYREHLVQPVDHLGRFKIGKQGSRSFDIGEQNADRIVVLGDGFIAPFESFGDVRWQDVEKKFVCPLPLPNRRCDEVPGEEENDRLCASHVHRNEHSSNVLAYIHGVLRKVTVKNHGDRQDCEIQSKPGCGLLE